jgi:hypothetical protein
MKINCENVSNRGNGGNCKISPKNPLLQSCTFGREYSKLNNKLNGDIRGKRISLCKNLNDCYAKENNHDYWQKVIVPQVQTVLCSENKKIEKEKKQKNPP